MYSEVTITDSSWLVTLGYFIISILVLIPLYLLSSEKFLHFRHRYRLKTIIILMAGTLQYCLAANGVDAFYRFFNYPVWHDEATIRFSAIAFFLVYALFMADWKSITTKKKKTEENSKR
ncbi:hypothetical protein [Erwinia psidii]|uniref:Uncharacterized protein n=1 Tax=Erwinia psidii TaxID=69224 RepID=A0A3N6RVE8_9GAMM|nr:hypothetical protein [Erwinia psidii]MCX8959394.1 hypothetical protein [Erwinia psidii]MCX8962650.1 hypothetical protein [Erwinia psidii]MCX8964246.1 hypothetical protein [Erwinia psidii]RQM36918.1 hypothetical protein EB241_18345 [Erwinia psidii]